VTELVNNGELIFTSLLNKIVANDVLIKPNRRTKPNAFQAPGTVCILSTNDVTVRRNSNAGGPISINDTLVMVNALRSVILYLMKLTFVAYNIHASITKKEKK